MTQNQIPVAMAAHDYQATLTFVDEFGVALALVGTLEFSFWRSIAGTLTVMPFVATLANGKIASVTGNSLTLAIPAADMAGFGDEMATAKLRRTDFGSDLIASWLTHLVPDGYALGDTSDTTATIRTGGVTVTVANGGSTGGPVPARTISGNPLAVVGNPQNLSTSQVRAMLGEGWDGTNPYFIHMKGEWGVVADGVADDTAAVTAALATIPSLNTTQRPRPTIIVLPPGGVIKMAGDFNPKHQLVSLMGNMCAIKRVNDGPALAFDDPSTANHLSWCSVENVILQAATGNVTNHGFKARFAHRLRLSRVLVKNIDSNTGVACGGNAFDILANEVDSIQCHAFKPGVSGLMFKGFDLDPGAGVTPANSHATVFRDFNVLEAASWGVVVDEAHEMALLGGKIQSCDGGISAGNCYNLTIGEVCYLEGNTLSSLRHDIELHDVAAPIQAGVVSRWSSISNVVSLSSKGLRLGTTRNATVRENSFSGSATIEAGALNTRWHYQRVDPVGFTNLSSSTVFPDNPATTADIANGAVDATKLAANLATVNIATTTGTASGVLQQGGVRLAHSYGTNNQFVGKTAGNFTLTGVRNHGFGEGVLAALTSGSDNLGVGYNVLAALQGGSNNVGVGPQVLQSTTGGIGNSGLGQQCLVGVTTGNYNSGFGQQAGSANADGSFNVYFGRLAGYQNVSGSNNVFVGQQAGGGITSGSGNLVLGGVTGLSAALSNNIIIGDGVGNIRLQFDASGYATFNAAIRLPSYTVATLPAAATAGSGAIAFATDLNAPTFGAIAAGGSTTKRPVYSDGTNWRT